MDEKLFFSENIEKGTMIDELGGEKQVSERVAKKYNAGLNRFRLKAMRDRLTEIKTKGFLDTEATS